VKNIVLKLLEEFYKDPHAVSSEDKKMRPRDTPVSLSESCPPFVLASALQEW